jgi:hypothetical protein
MKLERNLTKYMKDLHTEILYLSNNHFNRHRKQRGKLSQLFIEKNHLSKPGIEMELLK